MNLKEAIKVAEAMQLWRRGQAPYVDGDGFVTAMPCTPKEFGEAIDTLLGAVRSAAWQHPDSAPTLNKKPGYVFVMRDDGDIRTGCRVRENLWIYGTGSSLEHNEVAGWMSIPALSLEVSK